MEIGPNTANPTHLHRPRRCAVSSSKGRKWIAGSSPFGESESAMDGPCPTR